MSSSRQIRKREENNYPDNNYLSLKIRIAFCEMNFFSGSSCSMERTNFYQENEW